jgi:hypothetical protein
MHVNGFNIAATATSSTALSNGPSSTISSTTPTSATSTPQATSTSTGISAGAAAGIGVGVAVTIFVVAIVAFLLFRRSRKREFGKRLLLDGGMHKQIPLGNGDIGPGGPPAPPQELDTQRKIQELDTQGKRQPPVYHELHGSN